MFSCYACPWDGFGLARLQWQSPLIALFFVWWQIYPLVSKLIDLHLQVAFQLNFFISFGSSSSTFKLCYHPPNLAALQMVMA